MPNPNITDIIAIRKKTLGELNKILRHKKLKHFQNY